MKMQDLELSNSKDGFGQLGYRMETASISESGCGPAMVRNIEVIHHDFVVENYSRHKGIGVGIAIPSAEFVCGGHRWEIYLCPQGKNSDVHNQGFASVFLNRISHATHPTPLLLDIELLDQSGNQQHWVLSGFFYKEVLCIKPSCHYAGRDDFIRRAQLDSPHSPFLKNDSLKFRVRVGVFTYHFPDSSPTSSSSSYIPSTEDSSSTSSLSYFSSSEPSEEMQWGDEFVFIKAGGRNLCAAKSALAHRCPKLLSYDCHGLLQDIVIPDAELSVVKVAVVFISTGSIAIKHKTAIDDSDPLNLESFAAKLLAVTNMLELEPLKMMCEMSLSNKVSRDSIVALLHLAHICNATQLESACLKFEAQNRSNIMKSDEFSFSFQNKNSFSTLKEKVFKMYNTFVVKARKSKVGLH